jgi:predicted ATP-dependent endonuclease of OLD family
MPGLILAIEEPEVYQHPTKQRHFASVLYNLSRGELPGVAADMQVVFASHSPLFVSTDRFDEIRLARRVLTDGQEFKECKCATATLEAVARRLEQIWAKEEGTFNPDGVRARLHIINPEVAEGFFANLAVLVEGQGDRAAIMAAASQSGFDLEGCGIAVLPVNGKNNLDRPAVIFESLGIPTYIVWDCDSGTEGVQTNRALCRLGGIAEADLFDAQTRVAPSFTCFADKLESVLEAEIPSLQECIDEVRNTFGISKKGEVLKSAFAMREVLSRANARGHQSATLGALVDAIAARAAHA